MALVVANAFYNTQAFGLSFSEQYSVTRCEEFGSLNETEGNEGTVPRPNEGTVDVNHGACLADCAYVQHCLVSGFDGSSVRKNQN